MKIGQRFKRAGESYEFLRMLPSGTIEARRISTGEICRMLSAAQIKRKKQQEQELKNRQEQAALKQGESVFHDAEEA